MSYLLDTCVISDFFKKKSSIIKRFEATAPDEIHISTISVMEIEYGLQLNPQRETKLRPIWNSFIKMVHVLQYSTKCAEATSLFRSKLKAAGLPIGHYDILIAGTASAHRLTLVTSNMKEFLRLDEIHCESW